MMITVFTFYAGETLANREMGERLINSHLNLQFHGYLMEKS